MLACSHILFLQYLSFISHAVVMNHDVWIVSLFNPWFVIYSTVCPHSQPVTTMSPPLLCHQFCLILLSLTCPSIEAIKRVLMSC